MKRTLPLYLLLLILLSSFIKPPGEKYIDVKDNTITNLYDAFRKNISLTKHFGFSCITTYKAKLILFDSGSNTDIFKTTTTILCMYLYK